MNDLKEFCEKIRLRHLNADYTTTTCVFCCTQFKGYDALQSHIFDDHKIVLPPFDDIDDIDGFLDAVKALACPAEGTYTCLHDSHIGTAAQGQTFTSLAELEAHLSASAVAGANIADVASRLNDCRFWTWDVVPALAKFRFYTPDANDAEDDEEEEAINNTTTGAFVPMGDDEIAAEGTRVVEEGCGSSKIECPYCIGATENDACYSRYETDDFTAHLLAAHKIESFGKMLKAFKKADGEAAEFHELVMLINMIREKTDEGKTPFTNVTVGDEGNKQSLPATLLAELTTSGASSTSPEVLANVYVVSGAEYAKLLADAPNEDYYLLPKRPNDSLITYLLHADDGEDDEDEEEFPMVPTLRESTAAKKAAGNDSEDSD